MPRQIVRYLVQHPDAKDTIEGILRWWFAPGHGHAPGEVQAALDALVDRGWLVERTVPPGRKLYGASPGRLDEMRALLAADGSRPPTPHVPPDLSPLTGT
ncbi:MAG TPA: hypothetical protein VF142_20700 [Longimicrobium sp.]